MNKALFPLTIAVALTNPLVTYADTILYGEAKVSVDYTDNNRDPAAYWDIVNNGSKLGFRGSEDLGGGLSAFYQYDFNVDMTEGGNFEGLNQKFVGIKGGFGAVTLGTQDTPYWKILNIVDVFNSGKMFNGTIYLGGSLTAETDDNGALSTLANSIDYQTPIFNGFSAEALLVMDGTLNTTSAFSSDVDIWNINLKYNQGPYFAGLTYIKMDGKSNIDLGDRRIADLNLDNWGLGLGYKTDQWLISAIYEQGNFNDVNFDRQVRINDIPLATGDDAQSWLLLGQYAFGNNVLRAAYGQTDTGIDGEDMIDNYRLGYQYNFSKRTLLWAEYLGRDADVPLYGDQNVMSLGTKVLF